jgi:hypothetical protein
MSAHGAPRRPRAGERFIHEFLRGVLVADADQDGAQALIGGASVESREFLLFDPHTPSTHSRAIRHYMLSRGPRPQLASIW